MYSGIFPTTAAKVLQAGIQGALNFTRSQHGPLIDQIAGMFLKGDPSATIFAILAQAVDASVKRSKTGTDILPVQEILQEAFSFAHFRKQTEFNCIYPELRDFRNRCQATVQEMMSMAEQYQLPDSVISTTVD